MSRTIHAAPNATWRYRGRCSKCLAKVVGCRRFRVCHCGGRVLYR